jgi:hypothetical protein
MAITIGYNVYMTNAIISQAIQSAGGQTAVAKALNVRQNTVHKWIHHGLPRTEWTGETNYIPTICDLGGGEFTREQLLATRGAQTNQ